MFTGLVETVGTVVELRQRGNYRGMTISSSIPANELEIGESIACDGVCLTVVAKSREAFSVEASQETLAHSIAGDYQNGSRINLERAMKLGGRMGGHLVSGHVDDSGEVVSVKRVGESYELVIAFDPRFDRLVIDKGSIAINGISLTVNRTEMGQLTVNIIPHTFSSTTVCDLKARSRVNLEFDMIGKYILKSLPGREETTLTVDKLLESGW
ncbi:MAG: riboflavin synthase [candidate division Zixibacteria bacterium]